MGDIKARLAELRFKLNLTQGKFAEKMGIRQNTWSNIERGTNPCSERYIRLICLTFNVRREWLLYGQGDMFMPSTPTNGQSSPQESLPPKTAELVAIYNELVPLNQKAVIDFIEKTLQSQRNTINSLKNEN